MKLYKEVLGSGPDLVLLHGWGFHSGVWMSVRDELARYYRLTLFDLPGFGRSPALPGNYTPDAVITALLREAPPSAAWLGWSLGGLISLIAADRYPDRLEKLILVATTPCFAQRANWPFGLAVEVVQQFYDDLAQDYRRTLQRFLTLQTGPGAEDRAAHKRMRQELFRFGAPNESALVAGLRILRDEDVRSKLSGLTQPVLIISGERDRLVPVGAAQYLNAQIPESRLATIPGVGHAPFLAKPDRFTEEVNRFLGTDR